jgi:hypothetical protein
VQSYAHQYKQPHIQLLHGTTEEEKDVGIYISPSLKPGNHCRKAANKAQAVPKQTAKNFHYTDKNTFLKLYKQYVRPQLEFASSA